MSYSSKGNDCKRAFNTSDIEAPLSISYQPIHDKIAQLSSQAVAGRTNIGAGINDGIKVLTGSKSRKSAFRMMVVMTDGQHNMGPEPVIVAEQAAREDIVINTVTFSDGADFVRMKEVAAVTGGQHFHATSAMELEVIFRELAATLPVLLTQ